MSKKKEDNQDQEFGGCGWKGRQGKARGGLVE